MPRHRECGTCLTRHAPPTGKRCQFRPEPAPPVPEQDLRLPPPLQTSPRRQRRHKRDQPDPVLQAIQKLTQSSQELTQTVAGLATRVTGLEAPQPPAPNQRQTDVETDVETDASNSDDSDSQETAGTSQREELTVKALRKDQKLQRKVRERLHDLSKDTDEAQDSDTKKGKRSGRNKTVHDVVLHDVEWPQYHVHRTFSQKSLVYDELSLPEFVAGTLTAILEAETVKIDTLTKTQISHLIELMIDSEDFSWPVLRQFHGLVLQDLEMGKYSWGDSEKIQKRKMKHVARAELCARARPQAAARFPTQLPNRDPRAQAATTAPILCKLYNTGECHAMSPHPTPEGLARHCCSYCSRTANKLCTHPEAYCRRKTDQPHPHQVLQNGQNGAQNNSKN